MREFFETPEMKIYLFDDEEKILTGSIDELPGGGDVDEIGTEDFSDWDMWG